MTPPRVPSPCGALHASPRTHRCGSRTTSHQVIVIDTNSELVFKDEGFNSVRRIEGGRGITGAVAKSGESNSLASKRVKLPSRCVGALASETAVALLQVRPPSRRTRLPTTRTTRKSMGWRASTYRAFSSW